MSINIVRIYCICYLQAFLQIITSIFDILLGTTLEI